MDFHTGDEVMHSDYGLGRVLAVEERTFNDNTALYYMIQVADLTIWVPANENTNKRLRFPTSKAEFKKLLSILSSPAEPLPTDRRERNIQLLGMLGNGGVESLCKVIRDLNAYRRAHAWNDYDGALMKRAAKKLISEWCFSLSVTPKDAELEMNRLLARSGT